MHNTSSADTVGALMRLSMPSEAVAEAGAFAEAWVRVTASAAGTLNFTLTIYNKTATRLPEALFFRFAPKPCPRAQCTVHKVSSHVDLDDVVPGGAHHNHVMSPEGVQCGCAGNGDGDGGGGGAGAGATGFDLRSPDAPLLSAGTPTAFPTPLNSTASVATDGAALMLWQNIWNTNYIMWTEGDFQFRASVALAK